MTEVALAPVLPTVLPGPSLAGPVVYGVELYEAAMRGEVALSDGVACWELLRHCHPHFGLELLSGAQRVAIDLAVHVARRPHAGLVKAARAAAAMAEDVAGGEAEPHAVLAQIADVLDGALSLVSQD